MRSFLKKHVLLIIVLLIPANLILLWKNVSDRIKVNRIEKHLLPAKKFFKIIPLKNDYFLIYDGLHSDSLCVGKLNDVYMHILKTSYSTEFCCYDLKEKSQKIHLFIDDSKEFFLGYKGFFLNDLNGDGIFDVKMNRDLSEYYILVNGEWRKSAPRKGGLFLLENKLFRFDGKRWVEKERPEK